MNRPRFLQRLLSARRYLTGLSSHHRTLSSTAAKTHSSLSSKGIGRKFLPDTPCRTRFAPSPTGYLHLGSLRTALFNYLLARATGGQFFIRLEDTDQRRIVPDAEQRLYDDLRWAGLSWDEGPDIGGAYGPYKQSLRLGTYAGYVNQLLEERKVYRCFCSPEELEANQKHALHHGLPTDYPRTCLSISSEESAERAQRGDPHVVRFKSSDASPEFRDLVYGRFRKADPEKDFIIMKRDGFPTYHLANVVDDHLMDVTHVVRGAEWLISTPKHIELYDALGWDPPRFAHVGLLVDKDRQKLSKRHQGVNMSWYRDQNILPQALLNFAVLLGWNPRDAPNVMTLDEMADNFSMRFTKGDIVVSLDKLHFFQRQHVKRLLDDDTADIPTIKKHLVKPIADVVMGLEAARTRASASSGGGDAKAAPLQGAESLVISGAGLTTSPALEDYIFQMLKFSRPPDTDLAKFVLENKYVIWRPLASELETKLTKLLDVFGALSVGGNPSTPAQVMDYILGKFDAINSDAWNNETLRETVPHVAKAISCQTKEEHPRSLSSGGYQFLRWAILASEQGPPLAGPMEIFGKKETIRRLEAARQIAQ